MTPAEFEQLLSAWLDEPQRADLNARLAEALAEEPTRAALLREWQTLDRHVRALGHTAPGVNWPALHERICAAARAQPAASTLENALARLPGLDERIHWDRLRSRISAAVATADRQRHLSQRRFRQLLGVASALAAAAALVLAVLPATTPKSAPRGTIECSLVPPAPAKFPDEGIAYASIVIPAKSESQPEQLLHVDPIEANRAPEDVAGFY